MRLSQGQSIRNERQPSTVMIFVKSFVRNQTGMLGLFIVTTIILASIFATQLTGHAIAYIDPANASLSPNLRHPMGTDQLGQDVMTRVLYGGRASIYIGVLSSLIANIFGTVLGAIAGYVGGALDTFLMRISEIVIERAVLLILRPRGDQRRRAFQQGQCLLSASTVEQQNT